MVKLFIENIEIELDENVEFAITKLFEDLTNPTTIINDWSKTVEIPFTTKNNNTFGHIYNVDKQTINGDYTLMGLYFDPLKKLDFRLEYNDAVLMTGYAKMNRITKKDGGGVYEITLNGALGKVLQEMQKITFDAEKYTSGTTEYDTYYIKPSESFGYETLNKELVYDCWTGNLTGDTLQWIGFAPNNSLNDKFDYKQFQLPNVYQSESFITTLNNEPKFTNTGISASSLLDKGMLPKNIGEYRSYLQLPYVRFKKLFELFKTKTETITGYQCNLDSDWFSSGNTYYNDEVMMLKLLEQDNVTKPIYPSGFGTYNVNTNNLFPIKLNNNMICVYNTATGDILSGADKRYSGYVKLDFNYKLTFNDNWSSPTNVRIYYNSGIEIRLISVNAGTQYVAAKYLIVNEATNMPKIGYDGVFNMPQQTVQYRGNLIQLSLSVKVNMNKLLTALTNGDGNLYVDFKYIYKYPSTPTERYPFMVDGSYWRQWNIPGETSAKLQTTTIEINEAKNRSNSLISLNDLWNNDVLPYDVIINYCKIHKILLKVDDINKTINFIPSWKYFNNVTIEDWTNKLDLSKDYIITPCTLENKYVLFNYKDSKTKFGEEYREKYGFDFGELNLATNYNFNIETKKIFDKEIEAPIVYSDNNMSWNDLYNGVIRYILTSDILVYASKDDNKYVSNFGAFYFYNGITPFDTSFRLNTSSITDDTDFMIKNNTYMYNQQWKAPNVGFVRVSSYPKLDIVKNGNIITFNKPSEIYSYNSSDYTNAKSIYEQYWKNYITERYNSNNKKVTCYLNITPIDFMNFAFNKFIKIENQLYFVNKIYDYSITEYGSTKVDLITVQDITKYYTLG